MDAVIKKYKEEAEAAKKLYDAQALKHKEVKAAADKLVLDAASAVIESATKKTDAAKKAADAKGKEAAAKMLEAEQEEAKLKSLKAAWDKKIQQVKTAEKEKLALEEKAKKDAAVSEVQNRLATQTKAQAAEFAKKAAGLREFANHLARISKVSAERRKICLAETDAAKRKACEVKAALEELGHPAHTRCEIQGGARIKCEDTLCCGAAVRPATEPIVAGEPTVIESCQPKTANYYFHTPAKGGNTQLWKFTCIEAAKYISSAFSLAALLSVFYY